MSDPYALEEVEVTQTPPEKFAEFLRSRGKRITKPRRVIVEEVFKQHEHFDVEDFLEHLKSVGKQEQASRPTVYRTLSELVEAGLLREVTTNGRRAVYEHDYGYPQHDHLQCDECGKLIEFANEQVKQICEEVARANGFRAAAHRLIVSGTCAECQQAKRRRVRRLDLI